MKQKNHGVAWLQAEFHSFVLIGRFSQEFLRLTGADRRETWSTKKSLRARC